MSFYEQIAENKRKTFFLFLIYILFFAALAYTLYAVYDPSIAILIGILAIAYALVSWFFATKIVLAVNGAIPADKNRYKQLYNITEEMCIAAGMKMPKLFIIRSNAINACATGRSEEDGIVCVTTGALEKLNRTELQGVIAHELSHIQNNDILIDTLAAVLTGMLIMISDVFLRSMWYGNNNNNKGGIVVIIGIVFAILTPLLAQLLKLAISRKREFLADASAAKLTRYPQGLANALEKIKNDGKTMPISKATAHMFISNPLKKDFLGTFFSTHPPIEERIKKLRTA